MDKFHLLCGCVQSLEMMKLRQYAFEGGTRRFSDSNTYVFAGMVVSFVEDNHFVLWCAAAKLLR